MDDLYAEVMSLLHDTGAFADWQRDKRLSQAVSDTHYVAVGDLPPPANDHDRLSGGLQASRDPGGPPPGHSPGHSPAANNSSARRLPRPMSPSIAPE